MVDHPADHACLLRLAICSALCNDSILYYAAGLPYALPELQGTFVQQGSVVCRRRTSYHTIILFPFLRTQLVGAVKFRV
jgi:hypothetical protein